MRSLWLLSLFMQSSLAYLIVHRDPRWSPVHGVLGVPRLFVSILSSCTIFGQFRALSLRDAAILLIHELPRASTTPQAVKQLLTEHSVPGNSLVGGIFIDLKLFLCVILLIAVIAVLRLWLVEPLSSRLKK